MTGIERGERIESRAEVDRCHAALGLLLDQSDGEARRRLCRGIAVCFLETVLRLLVLLGNHCPLVAYEMRNRAVIC